MYRAPVSDIAFTLLKIADLETVIANQGLGELSSELLHAILEEAGRFAGEEMAPLGPAGDRHPARAEKGVVTTPPGWADLYRRWREGGWNGLSGPEEAGGQGLPLALSAATCEMWNSASMAFAIGPTLTTGAVEALETHGSEALKALYLPRLVSGEWMGTMNLTEPQAGSDLSSLRARAERVGDGTYRLFGQKIFITYGEHDWTGNIVHLVLARLPDAPAGVKGISLFLVPKFVPDAEGRPAVRNDVFCHSLEEKLGIHGSPTCTMIFGDGRGETGGPGAVGWLVGEENRGLFCMFTMMNNARLQVGMQGVGVAEAATQKALAFARERRQGRSGRWTAAGPMSAIAEHPDVARMLLTMQALTAAARAIAFSCAAASDRVRAEPEEGAFWRERANLLTPVAKAFATDIGVEVASLGIQVHGGMGFVEETGAARFLRDARIAPIYEGTNGIQAIDLVMRKLGASEGAGMDAYLAELEAVAEAVRGASREGLGATAERLTEALADLRAATGFLNEALARGDTETALAGATPYLRLFGLAAGATYLAKGALADPSGARDPLARFMAEDLLLDTASLKRRVAQGAPSLLSAARSLAS